MNTFSEEARSGRSFLASVLLLREDVGQESMRLSFRWEGNAPRAGQFFMVQAAGRFLSRPFAAAGWDCAERRLEFLITRVGDGTAALTALPPLSTVNLMGPLGNSWNSFIDSVLAPADSAHPDPADKSSGGALQSGEKTKPRIALVAGGTGLASFAMLPRERPDIDFTLFLGLKHGFESSTFRTRFLANVFEDAKVFDRDALSKQARIVIATEDGSEGERGFVTDALNTALNAGRVFDALFVCGPLALLRACAAAAQNRRLPCVVSMEAKMACGAGACLGCSIESAQGGGIRKRVCVDGPIFLSQEIFS